MFNVNLVRGGGLLLAFGIAYAQYPYPQNTQQAYPQQHYPNQNYSQPQGQQYYQQPQPNSMGYPQSNVPVQNVQPYHNTQYPQNTYPQYQQPQPVQPPQNYQQPRQEYIPQPPQQQPYMGNKAQNYSSYRPYTPTNAKDERNLFFMGLDVGTTRAKLSNNVEYAGDVKVDDRNAALKIGGFFHKARSYLEIGYGGNYETSTINAKLARVALAFDALPEIGSGVHIMLGANIGYGHAKLTDYLALLSGDASGFDWGAKLGLLIELNDHFQVEFGGKYNAGTYKSKLHRDGLETGEIYVLKTARSIGYVGINIAF